MGDIQMIRDRIGIKGEVTVKVIKKETGEIVKEMKSRNAVLHGMARRIFPRILSDHEGEAFEPVTTIKLLDPDWNSIKVISGSWGSVNDTGEQLERIISAKDESGDEYTVHGCILQSDNIGEALFRTPLPSDVSKAYDEILHVDWKIIVSYSP